MDIIESFNGKLRDARDECLKKTGLYHLKEAKEIIELWLRDYSV